MIRAVNEDSKKYDLQDSKSLKEVIPLLIEVDSNAKASVNNTIYNLYQTNTRVLYHGKGKKAF